MLKIRRGNSILHIKPEALDYYISAGYSLLDDAGRVIKKAIPVTKEELHRAYIEHEDTIKKLEARVAELQAENGTLKKKRTTTKKS